MSIKAILREAYLCLLDCRRWIRSKKAQLLWKIPPPPRELLTNREFHEERVYGRGPVTNPSHDTAVRALYRLYEAVVLDANNPMRNEIEYFWYRGHWKVADIPDPKDPDPERYACLAGMTGLLCISFNQRMGLLNINRLAPACLAEDPDKYRPKPDDHEEQPSWVKKIPPLNTVLQIPQWDMAQRDFLPLGRVDHADAEAVFAEKNVVLFRPHIYFV